VTPGLARRGCRAAARPRTTASDTASTTAADIAVELAAVVGPRLGNSVTLGSSGGPMFFHPVYDGSVNFRCHS
jgi:hypothetical protein